MTDDPNANAISDREISVFWLDQDSPLTFCGRSYVCADMPSGARVKGVARFQPAHLNALTLFFDRPPTDDDIASLHRRAIRAEALSNRNKTGAVTIKPRLEQKP